MSGSLGRRPSTRNIPLLLFQAFCRLCAVHGGIYVLQCKLRSVRYDPHSPSDIEIVTQYDQTVRCNRLCISMKTLMSLPSLKDRLPPPKRETISRMVSVVHRSIQDDMQQIFVVVPRDDRPIAYFLQVGPPTCPSGRFIVYGWCRSTSTDAKSDLQEAFEQLTKKSDIPDVPSFECYYQQMLPSSPGNILPHCVFPSGPSGSIGHATDIRSAASAFRWLYPDDAFLDHPSRDIPHEDSEDDMFDALEKELGQQSES